MITMFVDLEWEGGLQQQGWNGRVVNTALDLYVHGWSLGETIV